VEGKLLPVQQSNFYKTLFIPILDFLCHLRRTLYGLHDLPNQAATYLNTKLSAYFNSAILRKVNLS